MGVKRVLFVNNETDVSVLSGNYHVIKVSVG